MTLGHSRYYFDERVRGLKVRALECGSSSYRLLCGAIAQLPPFQRQGLL